MNRESAAGGGFVVAAICFVVCSFMLLRDLGHLLYSKRAEGTVTDVKHFETVEYPSRRVVGHSTRISFRFVEPDGTRREGYDEILGSSGSLINRQRGDAISIEFTTGDFGSSRIAGNYDPRWLIVFVISGGFLLVTGIVAWLQASRAVRALNPKKKKRKRNSDRDDEDEDAELQERLRSPKHSRGSRL